MAQINKPTDYFNTVLYTGNATARSITGVGFQPDYTVIKQRSGTEWHENFDVVRGTNKQIYWNTTNAEGTDSNKVTSFDSDGFSLGTANGVNQSSATYVAWNWLAGGTASSNTDGSITSSVSANTTSGFSIATYTGNGTGSATIGHGLGVAPKFVIIKSRSLTGESWQTWFDNDKRLNLNSTAVSFISTHPISTSSTVVTTPSTVDNGWNTSSATYVMYSFAEIKGYSKFGSYTGNGSADGTFVFCGFKPAFVMIKRTDSADSWTIRDNKRDVDNVVTQILYPDLSSAEATAASNNYFDILSNGFKLRGNSGQINGSGGTYIYMAFAESPLVGTNNIPSTAR